MHHASVLCTGIAVMWNRKELNLEIKQIKYLEYDQRQQENYGKFYVKILLFTGMSLIHSTT